MHTHADILITDTASSHKMLVLPARAGFNWWEASGPVYLGGTERLQQLYD